MKTEQLHIFHNTIALLPSEKAEREVKSSRQNDKILKLFQDNPHSDFTPCDVYLRLGQQYPITSVRRGITDMTKWGLLIKTNKMRVGLFSENNYCWKYNTQTILTLDEAKRKYSENRITAY